MVKLSWTNSRLASVGGANLAGGEATDLVGLIDCYIYFVCKLGQL